MNVLSSRQSGAEASAIAPRVVKDAGSYTPRTANTSRSQRFSLQPDGIPAQLYGGDNRIEVLCQEAGAANQAAIDVFDRQNLARILRFHRPAIENPDG